VDDRVTLTELTRLNALAEALTALDASLPLEDALRLIAAQGRRLFNARLAAISVVYGLGQESPLTVVDLQRPVGNERAIARSLENFGMAVQLYQQTAATRLSGAELSQRPAWHNLAQQLGTGQLQAGWLAAPLRRSDGQCLGYLQLVAGGLQDFTPADAALLTAYVAAAALLIENQWLNRSEQHARQAAETLRVASLALTQQLELEDVLQVLLDYLSWIVPYDCASVMLLENSQCLVVRAIRSYATQPAHTPQNGDLYELQDNPVLQELLLSRKALYIPDVACQPRWKQQRDSANRSWLGFPLVAEDRVLGLCALEKAEPGFFSETHQRLAEALAAQAAVAIQNASLFQRLSLSEERYRAAAELTSDFAYAFRLEADGRLTCEWVTDAFSRITGFAPHEVSAENGWAALTHPEDRSIAVEHCHTVLTGKPCISEYRIVTKEGQIRWLQNFTRPVWDAEQRRLTRCFGAARDITESRQRQRELEAVAGLASALRSAPRRNDMLNIILDHIVALVQADGAALVAPDAATGGTLVEAGCGLWAGWSGLRQGRGEGISGQVINSGLGYFSHKPDQDPLRSSAEAIQGPLSVTCIPLVSQETVVGALWVGRHTPLLEADLRLVNAVADIAANALQRAALFEQTERRLQRLLALRSVDRAIASSLDLQVVLNILLDQVTTQLGVHAAAIYLFDPAIQFVTLHAVRGFRSPVIGRVSLRLGEGYTGQAALDRRIVRSPAANETEPAYHLTPWLLGEGFVAGFSVPLVAKGQLEGVLDVFHRHSLQPDHEWLGFLETLAGQAAIAIENAQLFDSLQRTNTKLTQAYDATIEGWSRALELRDKETEGHSQRVTEMTLQLARAMGMSETELVHVRRGALLHDIGKMGIPDAILLRPGPLAEPEWQIMRLHPKYAYDMLSPIDYLRPALDIPYCHHEKWDGSGYPRGLKGEQIPLAARIFAIADVWDALSSDRPYGQAWPREKALAYIREQSGKYFDPKVVETFLHLFDDTLTER